MIFLRSPGQNFSCFFSLPTGFSLWSSSSLFSNRPGPLDPPSALQGRQPTGPIFTLRGWPCQNSAAAVNKPIYSNFILSFSWFPPFVFFIAYIEAFLPEVSAININVLKFIIFGSISYKFYFLIFSDWWSISLKISQWRISLGVKWLIFQPAKLCVICSFWCTLS